MTESQYQEECIFQWAARELGSESTDHKVAAVMAMLGLWESDPAYWGGVRLRRLYEAAMMASDNPFARKSQERVVRQ